LPAGKRVPGERGCTRSLITHSSFSATCLLGWAGEGLCGSGHVVYYDCRLRLPRSLVVLASGVSGSPSWYLPQPRLLRASLGKGHHRQGKLRDSLHSSPPPQSSASETNSESASMIPLSITFSGTEPRSRSPIAKTNTAQTASSALALLHMGVLSPLCCSLSTMIAHPKSRFNHCEAPPVSTFSLSHRAIPLLTGGSVKSRRRRAVPKEKVASDDKMQLPERFSVCSASRNATFGQGWVNL
jgi:hypothetical protein